MGVERTLSIVKPNAVAKGLTGKIVARFEEEGLVVRGMKRHQLSRAQAERFYEVHRARPFFDSLCTFMCSGPVVVMCLEGENAIARNRDIMGATDPKKAAAGTIRALFGDDIEKNAVHGSDAPDTARAEVAFFFSGLELV
ncbi:MAG TPA: nucleoside-diphosphate kinase [Myxococcota bacterium]|jgi:nucleoside-diphosphate kinase|nr:nucleoside-diphosphate kinase [Myxococcota bacterium]